MEEDDMDSLFEGMVLFTPSQLVDQAEEEKQQQEEEHHQHQHQHQHPHDVEEDDTTPIQTPSSPQSQSQSQSQSTTEKQQLQVSGPLDENLFSDLTILTPLQTLEAQSDPFPTVSSTISPTTTISRQISRKKKRAAGLRIGYGREAAFDDLLSLPTPNLNGDDTVANDDNSDPAILDTTTTTSATTVSISYSDPQSSSSKDECLYRFEHLKSLISDKLKRARDLVASVSVARKDSIRSRRKAAEDLNLASVRHSHLELQLEDACEAEDFETAERISQSLATAEKENQTLLLALKDAEAHCDAIDSRMHYALDSQIAAEQECASLLYSFAKDAENNAGLVFKKAETLSSKEMDEWFSSMEALEASKIQLDIESHFINEARLVVNDSIQHSIADDTEQKQLLSKKKDMLTTERNKLLALVKEKEMEIADTDSKIKAVDQRIADVVSGFQEIQSTINAKYDSLQSVISQMDLHGEALSTKGKEIDKLFNKEQDRGAKLQEIARVSEDEAKEYQEIVELRKRLKFSILKSMEDKVRLAKSEEKLTQDVQMLQQEVSASRASLQELSSTKSSIQQNISSFKQRIFFIDKRVPELEAEKKVAAAARNFREAARIAAEAKSLSVEKDHVQIDLEKATLELAKLEEDIKDTVSRLEDTEGLILSKEKEVAKARFQRLLLIAGAATAERFAALELGDVEESNLLLAEAEAAHAEAEKLRPIYNFKEDEFINLPKQFISMELVSNLGKKQLAELAASVDFPASQ